MQTKSYRSQSLTRVGENLYRNGEGTYYARLFKNGKQHKKSLETHDRRTAERKRDDFQKEVERGAVELPDITFDEVADKYLESLYNLKAKSKGRRVSCLKNIRPVFKGKKVRAITKQDVQGWATRRTAQASARTFNLDRETLVLVLEYAKESLGIILENPAKSLPKRKVIAAKIVPPTKDQFTQLVGLMDDWIRTKESIRLQPAQFIRFLAFTGMRLEEARNVLWQHVDFKAGTLLVTGGSEGPKNNKQRTIPLFPPVRNLLNAMKREENIKSSEPVFGIGSAKSVLKAVSKLIDGLPEGEYFRHHDMRHFFVSNALEAGVADHVIAAWVGHSDGGILVRNTYGHLRKKYSDTEAEKMTFKA